MGRKSEAQGSLLWQKPGWLKTVREQCEMSQEELSRHSEVSRSVIANYESGRTLLTSADHALKICMILEASGSREAGDALLGLLAMVKESVQSSINSVDGQIRLLQKRRAVEARRLEEIQSEEKRLKAKGR
jgi:transcriptional regulator with XRE-family HTH domain